MCSGDDTFQTYIIKSNLYWHLVLPYDFMYSDNREHIMYGVEARLKLIINVNSVSAVHQLNPSTI